MSHKIWMGIGVALSLFYGYDLIKQWIDTHAISYFRLLLFFGCLLLVYTQWTEMKKKAKKD
jgi:hypothetical protein